MPHHQDYFSIDLKSGKVIGIQADKSELQTDRGHAANLCRLTDSMQRERRPLSEWIQCAGCRRRIKIQVSRSVTEKKGFWPSVKQVNSDKRSEIPEAYSRVLRAEALRVLGLTLFAYLPIEMKAFN